MLRNGESGLLRDASYSLHGIDATACSELEEGDEVITSTYTYTASASVISHVGAKLKLVTLLQVPQMDYEQLEQAVTERTKAIIPVDYWQV